MRKIHCDVQGKDFYDDESCWYQQGRVPETSRVCVKCDYYKSLHSKPVKKGQKKKAIKPNPKVAIANQKLGDKKTRKKYKWEFLRRNKDYIRDYLKHRDEERAPVDIILKWDSAVDCSTFPRKLVDPKKSNPNFELGGDLELIQVWDPPINTSFLQREYTKNNLVSLFPPGTEIRGEKIRHWKIYDQKTKTLDVLNQDNYPDYLRMDIRILPFYQSTKFIKIFMKEFKKQLDLLLKAQRSVTDYKKANRPRLNLYDKYLEVYDLHEEKGWTFEKIAKKVFPREFKIPTTLKEKSRDQNPESAVKKAQYYHREAQTMINEGWKWI